MADNHRVNERCCACCGNNEDSTITVTLKACSQCQLVYYCSKACQISDWKNGHKQKCQAELYGTINNKNIGNNKGEKMNNKKKQNQKKFKEKGQGSSSSMIPSPSPSNDLNEFLKLKSLLNPADLSLPDMPGWPLNKQWPVSQNKLSLIMFGRYTYRYPGFDPLSDDNMLTNNQSREQQDQQNTNNNIGDNLNNIVGHNLIKEWNKLAKSKDAYNWEYGNNYQEYVDVIEPFCYQDECIIPPALDALQNIYLKIACSWNDAHDDDDNDSDGDNGDNDGKRKEDKVEDDLIKGEIIKTQSRKKINKLTEPQEYHKEYFQKAYKLMEKLVLTNELGCELPLARLYNEGNQIFNFNKDEEKALKLYEESSKRGGDGGWSSWHLHLIYREKAGNDIKSLIKSLLYCRRAAEQGQIPIACITMKSYIKKLSKTSMPPGIERIKENPIWLEQWDRLGQQNLSVAGRSGGDQVVVRMLNRIARPKSLGEEWQLYPI